MADTVNQLVNTACANNGALIHSVIEYVGGTVAVASLVANARKYLPAPLVTLLDAVALNFAKQAADTAAKQQGAKP